MAKGEADGRWREGWIVGPVGGWELEASIAGSSKDRRCSGQTSVVKRVWSGDREPHTGRAGAGFVYAAQPSWPGGRRDRNAALNGRLWRGRECGRRRVGRTRVVEGRWEREGREGEWEEVCAVKQDSGWWVGGGDRESRRAGD
jgi:hypothetical protein